MNIKIYARSKIEMKKVGVFDVLTIVSFVVVLVVIPIASAFGYCWHGQERECYVFIFLSWSGIFYWCIVMVALVGGWRYYEKCD